MRNNIKPYIYKDNKTLNKLYDIQTDEMEDISSCLQDIYNNSTIAKCNEDKISRWEQLLEIQPQAELKDRKNACLLKLQYRPPFTRLKLLELLKSLYGDKNFNFEILYDSYEVVIDVYEADWTFYQQFIIDIREMIPANMDIIYAVLYNYIYLNRYFTYDKLKENFTYEELGKYNKE